MPHIRRSDETVKAEASSSASGSKTPKALFPLLFLCMFGGVVHIIHGYGGQEVVTQQYSSKMRSHKEASWTREQVEE